MAIDQETLMKELYQALVLSVSPDTEALIRSTEMITNLTSSPECIPALFQIYYSATDLAVKQSAGILVRKKIERFWDQQNAQVQGIIKANVLQHVAADPTPVLRNCAADIVGAIAKVTVPRGQWPELLGFLKQCTESSDAQHRNVGIKLLGDIAGPLLGSTAGKALKGSFLITVGSSLANPANPHEVKTTAVYALSKLIRFVDDDKDLVMLRDAYLPEFMKTLEACIIAGDTNTVVTCYETFNDIIELKLKSSVTFLSTFVPFSLEVANKSEVDFPIRQVALSFVEFVSRFKPKTFKKSGFLQPTLGVIFKMCAEPNKSPEESGGNSGDDDDDDDESSPCIFAANILEGVVSAYPAKQVYAAATPYLSQYMESNDPLMRKAGFIGMTMLVEPCSEQMRAGLAQFVDYTVANFANPSAEVKVAALATMAQFAEHLRPEVLEYHARIIPAIFALLSGPDPEFQSKACVVFEVFASNMGQEVLPYAPQIMDCLLRIITSGAPDLKESALSALSAMLEACDTKENLAPYLGAIMAAVKPLCYLTGDEEIVVRGRALECIGVIAVMVGRDLFAPFLPEMSKNALDGLAIDSAFSFELHELTLRFFENIAQVVGKDFAQFLPQIMPFCINTMRSQEFDDFKNGGRDPSSKLVSCFNTQDALSEVLPHVDPSSSSSSTSTTTATTATTGNTNGEDDAYDSFEDALDGEEDDIDDDDGTKLPTDYLDLKAAACGCVGTYAEHTLEAFAPYIEECATALLGNINYGYDPITTGIVKSMTLLLKPAKIVYGIGHQNTQILLKHLYELLTTVFESSESIDLVSAALDSIVQVANIMGDVGILPYYPSICKYITAILERKSVCQVGMADENEAIDIAEEGESSEFKEVSLFEATGDAVNALAKALGERVVPFFLTVIKHFERLVDDRNNHYFKSLGVSTIAEVLRLAKLDPSPFINNLIRVVFTALADKDPVTRSNAVFCSGIIMQNAAVNGTCYHLQVMDAICPSLRMGPSADPLLGQLRDNAAGAVARMMAVPGSPLPLDTVLPLWMAALPLQTDFEEYAPVLNALALLLVQQQQRLTTFMPRVMETIAAAAAVAGTTSTDIVEPLKNVTTILAQVKIKFPADFAKLMSMLSQDCQSVIAKLVP